MSHGSLFRRIVVFLMLGLVATVITTLILAATVNIHAAPSFGATAPTDTLHWQLSTASAFGSERVSSEHEVSNLGTTTVSPRDSVPAWAPVKHAAPSGVVAYFERFEARGWPALAFWCRSHLSSMSDSGQLHQEGLTGAIELPLPPWVKPGGRASPRLFPLRPIWSGLVLDTLFFAVALAIVSVLAGHTIAVWRFNRGLCPKCKYSRHHDYREPCPECGWVGRRPGVA